MPIRILAGCLNPPGGGKKQRDKGGVVAEFAVGSKETGSALVIDVQGEVDMFTAPKLREEMIQAIEQGNHTIVVDLRKVSFMDSTGLGVLVAGFKRVKEHSGQLSLVCREGPVRRVLSITGLNNVFSVHDSLEAATGP